MKFAGTGRRRAAALVAVVLAACQNPVSPGGHSTPAGVEILRDGAVLARVQLGPPGEPLTTTGRLSVGAGQQTQPLTVRFLRSDGAPLAPGAGYYLMEVVSSAPGVARWEQATPGEFGGRLIGTAPGTANLSFALGHGAVGRGHQDGPTITVNALVEP